MINRIIEKNTKKESVEKGIGQQKIQVRKGVNEWASVCLVLTPG